MQLLLVRHGETQFNAEGRYLGSLDPSLTERGMVQARALSKLLPDTVDGIACSPLLRARQTAEVLCEARGCPLLVLEAFRGRHVGVFEGLTQAEARARYPAQWRLNVTRIWDRGPDGGESISEVVQRVRAGLASLHSQFAGKTVVLVAHGFVAKVIRGLVCGDKTDFFDWQLPNAGVLQLSLDMADQNRSFAEAAGVLKASIEGVIGPEALKG